MESKRLNRKEFLGQAGLILGAIVITPHICNAGLGLPVSSSSPANPQTRQPIYRIAGLPNQTYSLGFHKLCRYGRFSSVQEAMASVRNPRTEFLIVCD